MENEEKKTSIINKDSLIKELMKYFGNKSPTQRRNKKIKSKEENKNKDKNDNNDNNKKYKEPYKPLAHYIIDKNLRFEENDR